MGKKQNTFKTVEEMSCIENFDIVKNKHRFADSKYRHNVQFLYGLLKEYSCENSTKDILLNSVADDIKDMQNDIILIAGSQKLKICNEKFLNLIEIGENIWKTEKNPAYWWNQMLEVLKNMDQV